MMPIEASGKPRIESSEPILKSQERASSRPPPKQAPFMTAIVGIGIFSIL